jgi:hypothetical protein
MGPSNFLFEYYKKTFYQVCVFSSENENIQNGHHHI